MSSKFEKLKISKATVAAIRKFGGRFLKAEAGGHIDVGNRRAWDKTSQALREGQVEVRAKLATEKENGTTSSAEKFAQYKQVIEDQAFFSYACNLLQSLYDSDSRQSHSFGPDCLSGHASTPIPQSEKSASIVASLVSFETLEDDCAKVETNKSTQNDISYPDVGDLKCNATIDETKRDSGTQSANKTGANLKAVPLKDWIQKVLLSNGKVNGIHAATSQAYLDAALKIAKHLADQIIHAQELYHHGICEELEMLPISAGQDWAKYVVVRLNNEKTVAEDSMFMKHQFESPTAILDSVDMNDELESLYQLFEETDKVEEDLFAPSLESTSQGTDDKYDVLTATFDLDDVEHEAAIAKHSSNVLLDSEPTELPFSSCEEMSYFDIASAEIQCLEGKPMNKEEHTPKESFQRIYFLGLILYELFSGGEIPTDLCALAMCEGAFISLSTLTLMNRSNGDLISSCSRNKRHQGPGEIGLCESSCEYLRLTGITHPICRLIFNMLDSVHGDFSGKDSYVNMTHVTSDLQLMIDKPKFLRGLDMDKLGQSSLPVNEIEIPREEEFEAVKSSYYRCMLGSSEVAIIKGDSGTGKSWLAHRVGRFVISEGGLFLTGKFDQMREAKPFSALASAFDQYCDLLLAVQNTDLVQSIADELKVALGQDSHHLFYVIPKLRTILGERIVPGESTDYHDSVQDENYRNIMRRLQYLLSVFVDVISTNSLVSVVLYMDDVQWIDEASLGILKRILKQKPKKFFFLSCFREDGAMNDHPFWDAINALGSAGVHATQITLNCMTKVTLDTVVSELLCLSPRLVRSLSSLLFNKSKGNALFFLQLLMLLFRDGLLHLDFNRERWVWDEVKIASMKLPDNIAICLTNGIVKLPIQVQFALNILSMFGASTRVSYLKLLESQMKIEVLEPLKEAVAEGFVTALNDSFCFCHDRIQEASLTLFEESVRRSYHLTCGLCLVQRALDANDNDMLFTAVDQINLGGPSTISDYQDYFKMAKYNLVAGQRAMNMAEFGYALRFFMNGIGFLRDGHWQDHYAFSLEIYESACKTGMYALRLILYIRTEFVLKSNCSAEAAGRISDLNILSEQVLKHARCFEDTVEIQVTTMTLLSHTNAVEALNQGLFIVSKLGEEIPKPTEEALDEQIKYTHALIKGISEEHFLNYKLMSNTTKLVVMRILVRLNPLAHMISPATHPFLILKMFQMTIIYGALMLLFILQYISRND